MTKLNSKIIDGHNYSPEQVTAPKGAVYHDKLAKNWNRGYKNKGFRRRLLFINNILHKIVKSNQCWLDAGCGGGILTYELDKLGAHGDAIDASLAMINSARSEYSDTLNFKFMEIHSIENINKANDYYDGVLCSSVIEYTESPSIAVAELSRVLRPEGTLFISVANKKSAIRIIQRSLRKLLLPFGVDVFSYLSVSSSTFHIEEITRILIENKLLVQAVDCFDPILPKWTSSFLPPSLFFIEAKKLK